MSDNAPGPPADPFALRRARREIAPRIEQLANDFFERSEPLRLALNRVLQAYPDGWADELFKSAALFPRDPDGAVIPRRKVHSSPHLPDQLARFALVQMVHAAAAGNRVRFDECRDQLHSEPGPAAHTQQELRSCAESILEQAQHQSKEEFISKVVQVLANVELELRNAFAVGFIVRSGGNLTVKAKHAMRCWEDPDYTHVPIRDGLIAAPGLDLAWVPPRADPFPSTSDQEILAAEDLSRLKSEADGATTPTGAEGKANADAAHLTTKQVDILRTLLSLKALGQTSKTTRDATAKTINRHWGASNLARDFQYLKEVGYTDSAGGPDGGVWLTLTGRERAKALEAEEKQS